MAAPVLEDRPQRPTAENGGGRRVPGWLAAILREPLTHFLLVGLAVFLAAQAWRGAHSDRRIVVTPAVIADLSTKHRMQFGAAPGRKDLERLVDGWIDEEVLYREGKAQGLDANDEIVRRRVAQKAQFLLQDLHPPPEPSAAALKAWYSGHRGLYREPAQYSFTQLFFSPARGGEAAARSRAMASLGKLQGGASPRAVGADPFPEMDAYADLNLEAARRVFGATELTERLPSLPVGRWEGPLRSPYGWHLVRVTAVRPARDPPFAAVQEQVRGDLMEDAQRQANVRAFAAVRAHYQVVRADRPAAP